MIQVPANDPADQDTLQLIQRFHDADEIMALMTPDCLFENTYPLI